MATFDRMDSTAGGLDKERDHDTNDYDAGEEEGHGPNLSSHGQQQLQKGNGGDAMSLLASYYGLMGGGDEQICDEIDRSDFHMKAYVHQLLERDSLETLLIKDDELVQEVKRLDSDMQMLVYENYSKFISATDTIRTMKNNVNDMKAEMDALVKNMEGIASRMQVVNSFLGDKRAKVDKLVSVRRLLKRLDFLFDLPINLNRYVQRQDFALAVACYSKAIDILRQHNHVPSFKSIQHESDQIIAGVRDELHRRLRQQADTTATVAPATPDQLAQYVHLLLELGVPKAELQSQVLKTFRGRFGKTLTGFSRGEEERRANEMAKGEEGAAAGAEALEAALTKLNVAFVKDFEEAVFMFRDVFVLDSGNAGRGSSETAGAELVDLVRTLFTRQYLEIVKRLFKANLAIVASGPRGDDKQFPLKALEHFFQGSIRRLHKQTREAGVLEAGVALVQDVARGLIFLEFRGLQVTAVQRMLALQQQQQQQQLHFAPREQLEGFQMATARDLARVMETLQGVVQVAEEGVQDAVADAAAAAAASSPSPPTNSSDSDGLKNNGGASSSSSSSSSSSGAYKKPLAPELGMGQYVFQFVTWLADAGERMAGVTFRLTENDVVEVGEARRRVFPERFFAHASSFSSFLNSEQVPTMTFPNHTTAAAASPQYALLLAVLCRGLQNTLWSQATATLALVFPATMTSSAGGSGGGGSGGSSGGYIGGRASCSSSGTNKLSPEDVVMCLNGSTARLLQHYIEGQGHELALLTKTQAANSDSSSSNSVGGVTQAIWGKTIILRLEALVKELGAALGVSVAGVGLLGGRRGERADLSRTPGPFGASKRVHVDIERIFTVKVQVFGQPVELGVESVLTAVLKAACKELIECTRLTTLSRREYCQLQVDVQLLRQAVGTYLKDASVLETMLEEVLISAGERTTVEALQGVDPQALSAVALTEYTRLSSSLGVMGTTGRWEGGFPSALPSVR